QAARPCRRTRAHPGRGWAGSAAEAAGLVPIADRLRRQADEAESRQRLRRAKRIRATSTRLKPRSPPCWSCVDLYRAAGGAVTQSGTRGDRVDSIERPIAAALRLSHEPPGPVNVSRRA